MRKVIGAVLVAVMLLGSGAALTACGGSDASKVDILEPKQKGKSLPEDYETRVPDKLTVYQNIDLHPTIAIVCIDGLGFFTTSRDFTAAVRLPEKDKECATKTAKEN